MDLGLLDCVRVGKTVPSYRVVLEEEISGWRGFAKTLRREDLLAFEGLMDMFRGYAMAGGGACRSIVFEAMVMSILPGQQRKILALEKKLKTLDKADLSNTESLGGLGSGEGP